MKAVFTCENDGTVLATFQQLTDPEDMTDAQYTFDVSAIPPCPIDNEEDAGGLAERWLAKQLYNELNPRRNFDDQEWDTRAYFHKMARILLRIIKGLGDPTKLPTTPAQAQTMWNNLNKS